ncbi:MAG TPA: SDR family NAD(P)-dependent oxidoreductase, partial [Novosphingobium sp.]|nr:SDR family NAD(P)-dependent oxidoreductase [Novosphingobium sp.]
MFLSGKRALVTGSTSGIGLGIARALHDAGAEVVLNGFGDEAVIAALCAELDARHVAADLTRREGVETLMGAAGPV